MWQRVDAKGETTIITSIWITYGYSIKDWLEDSISKRKIANESNTFSRYVPNLDVSIPEKKVIRIICGMYLRRVRGGGCDLN